MKNQLRALALLGGLAVVGHAHGYYGYAEDNPLVEAMLRMMEIFGMIDRDRLPSGVPYLPAYGYNALPGVGGAGMPGGYGGLAAYPGLGGLQAMTPYTPWAGAGGLPGLGQMPGAGGLPGLGQMPGAGGLPGYPAPTLPYGYGQGSVPGLLDGVWELSNGAVVIIRGTSARLYVSRDRYQDYRIGYDRTALWWAPLKGGGETRYRYRLRDGRMVLGNDEGEVLLMRRRRP